MTSKTDKLPQVTYYGAMKLSDEVSTDCVVLEDGRRGYVYRSFLRSVDFKANFTRTRILDFCADFAPNALKYFKETSSSEIRMPNGATGFFVEAGAMTMFCNDVIGAALDGKLGKRYANVIAKCRRILSALGKVGEVGLIDEATGYQYHRAPDALQDLFTKLIREKVSDWERRFHPDFYRAVCKVYGFKYGDKHHALPSLVGKVTRDWVYDVAFPQEIMEEIKSRQRSERMHQWLQDGGVKVLEKQIAAVTLIAQTSVDKRDFEARCAHAFFKPGKQLPLKYAAA